MRFRKKIFVSFAIVFAIITLVSFARLFSFSNEYVTMNLKQQQQQQQTEGVGRYDEKEGKPSIFFHVGTGKAGSSTIQNDFKKRKVQNILRQDNVIVIPHHLVHTGRSPLYVKRSKTEKGDNNVWKFSPKFEQFVKKQKESHNSLSNIFGSSEYKGAVNPSQCRLWKNTFMESWNVEIILIYRRLHSRLPSVWNQYYKYFRQEDSVKKKSLMYKLGLSWIMKGPGHKYWPGIGGDIRIPSIEEWLVKHPHHLQQDKFLDKYYDAWKDCSHGFHVMSIHDVDTIARQNSIDNLTAELICKTMKLDHTCEYFQERKVSEKKDENKDSMNQRRRLKASNTSINLNHDILAVFAYENGYLTTKDKGKSHKAPSRKFVVKAIEKYVKKKGITYPMKCPEKSLMDQVYAASLRDEEIFYSFLARNGEKNGNDFIIPVDENDLKDIKNTSLTESQFENFVADWNKTLNENKFCVVDAEKVMEDEDWQMFFNGLH